MTSAIREKLSRFRAQLPYLPRAFQLVWQAAPRQTVVWLALLILQALVPVATVYLTRYLVDSLSLALESNLDWQSLRPALVWMGLLALVLLLNEALNSITSWVRTAQAELVQDSISSLIHAKATTIDLAFYDSPDYYDRLYRAYVDTSYRPLALLENLGNLAQSLLTFIAMAGVLLTFGWWVPLLLVIGVFPALFVVIRTTLREYDWLRKSTADRRRANYYDWLIANHEAAAEIRLFALGDYFRQSFQKVRSKLRNERMRLARQQAMSELSAGGLALVTMGIALIALLRYAPRNLLSLGNLVMFYQSFQQGQRLMRTLLGSVAQIYTNILFLENLFEFLEIQPQLLDSSEPVPTPNPLRKGIEFCNINFHYPGSERLALHQFNLTLPAGKIVAVVGENGAGKSTLIKLLCRFYDPDGGTIYLDGVDLRHFVQTDLRRQISVLFQQPVYYHATAAENIGLGSHATNPSPDQITAAAQIAGADEPIERLPEGYATMLGKRFGGAELSGGEWQRLALARAFLRQAPIIVLDEPTSAMDSWAEADWMKRFRTLAANRTVLIITHRFTTAMQADMIHVMAEGTIVESGTHIELLAQKGRYAHSWNQQMRY